MRVARHRGSGAGGRGGTLGEIKRDSRARTVRLGVVGETMPAWLGAVPGVLAVRPGAGFAEVELGADVDPDVVLSAALARRRARDPFDLSEPSLETIFIELVGRPADDDTDSTLAAVDDEADDPDAPPTLIEGAA